ncbi:DUF2059 domain-containing protein [Dyadobacter psychrotolerans]|uniref:DUF2059 domain-containing protein n=1 Tax=Dyadobacter psychrotolerans TaxID=2541721 RepID=A0A4R5DXY0_9BACT|nr:DUF2059 domain-containing protein [Dyadobacter psychrotolerans]TDE17554.1 DUF2059 domain-containing protein [Dyadobacter psychrotolerans]
MKKITSILTLFILSTAFTFGQSSPAYTEKLKTMFEVSGSAVSYKAAIKQMFLMFKKQKPSVPEDVWTEFEAEFLKTSLDDLVVMLEPVYAKHLTIEDLNQLITFYETPTGRKFAKKTPMIMTESMQVGQQWGTKIGKEFQEKLKVKGY